MSKEKLVPELRFPEFKDGESWANEELGQISEIVRGGSPRPIQDYLTNVQEGLNWLKIADVLSDAKYITGTKEKVLQEALKSTREVNPGDLILSNSMSFGRPYILKIKTCIHDGWIAIRKISNKTFEDYLYYFISSEVSQDYFNSKAAGAAIKNLNAEIIKLLPIYLPKNKNEQQKIASCLSSLDEAISAYNQKLELLKDYKKGLMQNLFPRDGEKVPKYRFSGFKKEWKKTILTDHIDLTSGYAFKSELFSRQGQKLITPKNFTKDGKASFNEKNTKYTIEEFDSKYFCIANDLLLLLTDLTPSCELLGKPILLKPEDGEVLLNQRIVKVIMMSSKLDKRFLLQYFLTDEFHRRIKSTASGSTVRHSSNKIILDTHVVIPHDIEEQQKIASCLSSLDELITAQAEKIEQLKLHKKGLMQGLFPKIND